MSASAFVLTLWIVLALIPIVAMLFVSNSDRGWLLAMTGLHFVFFGWGWGLFILWLMKKVTLMVTA